MDSFGLHSGQSLGSLVSALLARRDSGILEFFHGRFSSVKQCRAVVGSQ